MKLEELRSKTNNLRNKKARKYGRSYVKGFNYVCKNYKGAIITSFYDVIHLSLYWRHLMRLVFFIAPLKALIDTFKYKKYYEKQS
jgi:hypothetical protein